MNTHMITEKMPVQMSRPESTNSAESPANRRQNMGMRPHMISQPRDSAMPKRNSERSFPSFIDSPNQKRRPLLGV